MSNATTGEEDKLLDRPNIQKSASGHPLKIDCDCSRGRGNFDEGTVNDYDSLPKDTDRRNNYNNHRQGKPLIKSKSMDISKKNRFRYTPGLSDEQSPISDKLPQQNNLTQSLSSPIPPSPRKDSKNVVIDSKPVEDHKYIQTRKKPHSQGRNDRRGKFPKSASATPLFTIGDKFNDQPNKQPPLSPTASSPSVQEWRPVKQ